MRLVHDCIATEQNVRDPPAFISCSKIQWTLLNRISTPYVEFKPTSVKNHRNAFHINRVSSNKPSGQRAPRDYLILPLRSM